MVDPRSLNAQMQHDTYTLSLIEQMLLKPVWRRTFTVINLKRGYHQMPVADESRACTAMSTPLGERISPIIALKALMKSCRFCS